MQYQLSFKQSLRGIYILLLIGFMQACTTSPAKNNPQASVAPEPQIPIVYYDEFGKPPEQFSEADIFTLSAQQQTEFLDFVNDPSNRNVKIHRRVANYLKQFNKEFNYHSDTLIASKSAAIKQGNCLSLAILTTAFAQLANVEVGYELMHTPPVYEKIGKTILSGQHVRSVLYDPELQSQVGTFFMLQPVIKIDYFPVSGGHVRRRVAESEFVSMFFRNKAAEAIVNDQMSQAFWLSIESLKYTKNNAHATNMLALIYDRLGYKADAEKLYKFGINHADERLELLSNYHSFLVRNNRGDEASKIQKQIALIDDPNPFDWMDLGDEAFANNELSKAEKYYQKVIDLAPYLHHGYAGIGRVEFLKGNSVKAKKAFTKAAELAFEPESRTMYQAKLAALTAYTKN